MLDSEVTFAGAWVPQGTYISQIVAFACVHIWAPGQVLGIRAQLQGSGLCLLPHNPHPKPTHSLSARGVLGGGGMGGQKHTSDQRDAGTFPSGGQNCIYQQNGEAGFTLCLFECDSKNVFYCGALALCTVILRGVLLLILLIDWNVMACVPNQLGIMPA